MARMIDGDKLVENLRLIATCWSVSPYVSKEKHNGAINMLREVVREVKEAPALTSQNEPERAGLYGKYTVYKNEDGSRVTDCFILRPAKDPAAVIALRAYAAATNNAELSTDIINWVGVEPNEPLALDELREMDGEPVWVDDKKTWALLQVWDDDNIDAVFPMPRGCFHAESVVGKKIYRRPPEGEEDT